jgi:drug/metabolite transporter (DMT)-like permease
MNSISLVFSMMVLLAVCWTLGNIVADKILSEAWNQNPVVIVLIGSIILICLLIE